MTRWPRLPAKFQQRPKGQPRGLSMNKLETRYAEHLELRKKAGEVAWWKFEGVKLRLAKKLFFTPDFFIQLADGRLVCAETKGHWRDDARAKIKMAAEEFRFFGFVAVQWKNGTWVEEEF